MTRALPLLALLSLLAACAAPAPSYYSGGGPTIICQPASLYDHSNVLVCH